MSADRVGGRYRIEAVLGRGGMATVYRARDELLGRTVALKELVGAGADKWRYSAFADEAHIIAALSHPHIIQIHDLVEDEGRHYIVMEYAEGGSLRDLLDRGGGKLEPQRATALAAEVAAGLAHAHAAGVVHSDIKPQNILLDGDGHAKLADFGIARTDSMSWAAPTTVIGSAAYLAPEQIRGERPDASSDVYSLGIVLYEMLSGRLPFEGGGSPVALASQRLVRDPAPLSAYAPDLPRDLDALVHRCLAREPGQRATSVSLAAALQDYSTGRAGARTVPLGAPVQNVAVGAPVGAAAGPAATAARRRNWPAGLLLVGLAFLMFAFLGPFGPGLSMPVGGDSAGNAGAATPTPTPVVTITPSPSSTPIQFQAPAPAPHGKKKHDDD